MPSSATMSRHAWPTDPGLPVSLAKQRLAHVAVCGVRAQSLAQGWWDRQRSSTYPPPVPLRDDGIVSCGADGSRSRRSPTWSLMSRKGRAPVTAAVSTSSPRLGSRRWAAATIFLIASSAG